MNNLQDLVYPKSMVDFLEWMHNLREMPNKNLLNLYKSQTDKFKKDFNNLIFGNYFATDNEEKILQEYVIMIYADKINIIVDDINKCNETRRMLQQILNFTRELSSQPMYDMRIFILKDTIMRLELILDLLNIIKNVQKNENS